MPNVYLDDKWTQHCANLPETGMGWQRAKITLKDGRSLTGTIYNCHIINVQEPYVVNGGPNNKSYDFEVGDISDIEIIKPAT